MVPRGIDGRCRGIPMGMGAPQRLIEGYLLAAAISEETEPASAAGLHDPPRRAILRAASELRALDPDTRRNALRRIAALLREPPPDDAALPPRARAIVARDVSREVGRAWIASAPAPRRGFVASAALREVVRRTACSPTASERARREIAELREAGCPG